MDVYIYTYYNYINDKHIRRTLFVVTLDSLFRTRTKSNKFLLNSSNSETKISCNTRL